MKVTFLPENLIKFLPLINKVLPSSSQVPILSNILLEADKDGFYIVSTDLDLGARIKIPAKIEEEGGVTVPGREFMESINNLPKEKVEIETEKDSLKITSADNKLLLNTINKEEYPQIYKEKGERVTKISHREFVEVFSNIIFSISQEETRPQLNGAFIDVKDSGVNFVTTDGYRMSVKKRALDSMKEARGLIVPSKLIIETLSLKDGGDVVFYINEKERQIIFEVDEALLVGRMIEGTFPDYERVLPKKSTTEVVFDREGLLQHARLISVLARNNSNISTLSIKDGNISLETKSQGVGGGEAVLECSQKGEDVKISFNIKYLNDVLKADKGKEMKLKLNSPSEPAVFENEAKDFIHVIMPIQVD